MVRQVAIEMKRRGSDSHLSEQVAKASRADNTSSDTLSSNEAPSGSQAPSCSSSSFMFSSTSSSSGDSTEELSGGRHMGWSISSVLGAARTTAINDLPLRTAGSSIEQRSGSQVSRLHRERRIRSISGSDTKASIHRVMAALPNTVDIEYLQKNTLISPTTIRSSSVTDGAVQNRGVMFRSPLFSLNDTASSETSLEVSSGVTTSQDRTPLLGFDEHPLLSVQRENTKSTHTSVRREHANSTPTSIQSHRGNVGSIPFHKGNANSTQAHSFCNNASVSEGQSGINIGNVNNQSQSLTPTSCFIPRPSPSMNVYETSTGTLFCQSSTHSSLHTGPKTQGSRNALTRPDGVHLIPRRKSYSESTATRFVEREGSSARSRGLETFSELSSGYHPSGSQPGTSTPSLPPPSAQLSTSSINFSPQQPNSVNIERPPGQHNTTAPHQHQSWAAVMTIGQSPLTSGLLTTSQLGFGSDCSSMYEGHSLLPIEVPSWWHSKAARCDSVDPSTTEDKDHFYKKLVKKAGPYILGPRIGSSPVRSIVQLLARKTGSDKFNIIKILTLSPSHNETMDDRQGKMLMLTEFSLLSQLTDMKGVVHCKDFFKDKAWDSKENCEVERLCLVLDCLIPHDYDPQSHYLINLQHHVIHEKKLGEKEALIIFWDIARVVEQLHKRNIVHRDLKLGNMIVDRRTWRVTICNFCLGKQLSSDKDKLQDQRGSPAYISPDVLSGKPYYGKPSDMWALGVVLFTMLYGQFPFYDCMPQELFRKIKSADFSIPNDGRVTEETKQMIQQLLTLDSQTRMTASQVVDALETIIGKWKAMISSDTDQVVPNIHLEPDDQLEEEVNDKRVQTDSVTSGQDIMAHVPQGVPSVPATPLTSSRQLMIKMTSDARPMSPAEIQAIRHLFLARNSVSGDN